MVATPLRLWAIKSVVMALLAIALVAGASSADSLGLGRALGGLSSDAVESFLKTLTATLLVIATSAVVFLAITHVVKRRYFLRVVVDRVSHNALTLFIGTSVFAVAASAITEDTYKHPAQNFLIFVMALMFLVIAISSFLQWVSRAVQLGRFDSRLDELGAMVLASLEWRRLAPGFGGVLHLETPEPGQALYAAEFGYLHRIDVAALQRIAVDKHARIFVEVLPGAYIGPKVIIARLVMDDGQHLAGDCAPIANAFTVGAGRAYDSDPRLGLTMLSALASPTMSTFVINPHVASAVVVRLSHILTRWAQPLGDHEEHHFGCDRVAVPRLSVADMFDGAFELTLRNSANNIEVMLCLQEALGSLAQIDEPLVREAAIRQGRLALARGEESLGRPADVERLRAASLFTDRA